MSSKSPIQLSLIIGSIKVFGTPSINGRSATCRSIYFRRDNISIISYKYYYLRSNITCGAVEEIRNDMKRCLLTGSKIGDWMFIFNVMEADNCIKTLENKYALLSSRNFLLEKYTCLKMLLRKIVQI